MENFSNTIIFKNPEDPFLNSEFVQMLGGYVKIAYVNKCPTFDGKTFFWSSVYFSDIKSQYLINTRASLIDNKSCNKLFFFKQPSSYPEAVSHYSKNFRAAANKAKKQGLILEIITAPTLETVKICYEIYQANMDRLKTFSFSLGFFQKLSALSYSNFWIIKKDAQIISFALMLGNLMFIQSSNQLGKELCANNFLYDCLLKELENNYIFFGIASKNNRGLFNFKKDAGLNFWPAKETKFDIFQHFPLFLRDNFLAWWLLKLIKKDRLIKYCLPY